LKTEKELILKGLDREEIQRELESLNVGRLRIAAKGVDRDASLKTKNWCRSMKKHNASVA